MAEVTTPTAAEPATSDHADDPEVVYEANTNYEVKESPIHGYGLFATDHIPADTFLGCYAGPIVYDDEDDGEYVLWVLDEDGSGYGIDGRNELSYVNHDPNANALFYEEELWTTRAIQPGEEICHYYGEEWDEEEADEDEVEDDA